MKKISVKELVEFRRKSDRGKKTFVEKIKSNIIEAPAEGGGDYWISCLSAICNSYRNNDLNLIDDRVEDLVERLGNTNYNRTKNMYQQNISILQKYKNLDVQKLRPNGKLFFLNKSTGNPILTIKGLQIEAKPSLIYTLGKDGKEKVGAIWFIAKKDGYTHEEVGMFCDMLYRFLKHNFSKKYQVDSQFSTAVEMVSGRILSYSEVVSRSLSTELSSTLDEINRLM